MASLPANLLLAGWSYLNQIVVLVAGLLQIKILTHVLSQAQYGSWVQLTVTSGLIVSIANLNLGHGMLRLASAAPAAVQHRYLATALATQSVVVLLLFGSAWSFSSALIGFVGAQDPAEVVYLLLFVNALSSLVSAQLTNYLTITNRALRMVKIATFTGMSSALLIAMAAWYSRCITGVMLGSLSAQIVIITIVLYVSRINWSLMRFQSDLLIALARLGVPLMMVSISNWAITSSNRYFINAFLGADAVARFNVANSLPLRIVLVYTLLSSVFFAKISQMYDERRFRDVSIWMSAAVKYFLLIGVALSVVIISGSRHVTLLIASEAYLFEDLSLVYMLLATGNLAFGLFLIFGRVFDLEKRPWRSTLNWLVAMAVNALFCWLLIPPFGLVGAAGAMPLALISGLCVATGHQGSGIRWQVKWLRTLVYVFVVFVFAYAFSRFWGYHLGIASGLASSLGLGAVAIGFGFALGILERTDIRLMVRR